MSDAVEDDPSAKAKEKGLVIVLPGPLDVFIDLDAKEDRKALNENKALLAKFGFTIRTVKETVSPGGNCHVYMKVLTWAGVIRTDPLTELERVALQAILGSDRKREAFGLIRSQSKFSRPPSVLLRKA